MQAFYGPSEIYLDLGNLRVFFFFFFFNLFYFIFIIIIIFIVVDFVIH